MLKICETDLFGTGKPEITLETPHLNAVISPHMGGRVVDVKAGDKQFLYATYPEARVSGYYREFGGIDEFLDRPPGMLWRMAWQSRIEENVVNLSVKKQPIFLEKRISLDETMPAVRMEYSLLNTGPNLVRHAFGIHAEICLDGDIAANRFHVPTEKGMLSGGCEQIKKRYVRPSQGWCASTGKNSLIAMLFPDKLLDGVEAYYPEVGTHLNLSPLIYYIGLAPGKEARFTCAMYFGEGDADFAAELWKKYADGLLSQYVSVSKDRLEMAAEFEAPEIAQMPEGDEKSEERQWLVERMNELEKHKEQRMEILHLLRDKQINAAEAIRRLKGGKAV